MAAKHCMNPAPASPPEEFASALEGWFAQHRKDYPWRRTRDPYAILVAEVMLQQTQIATVLELTESRVSQIRSKALGKLRGQLGPLRGAKVA